MLNIGMTELLSFGVIALLILGPEKLPEAVRFIGKWYGKMKRTMSNIQNDLDRELRLSELRSQMQSDMQRIQELEAQIQIHMTERHHTNLPTNTTPIASQIRAYQPIHSTMPLVYHPTHSLQITKETRQEMNIKGVA